MKKFLRWRFVRWTLLGLLIVLLGIQFVPVNRANPAVETEVPAPANVLAVLRRSCYDCHSNETVWPWYSHVAPVSWLLARDVQEGRRHLNFSTWNKVKPDRQARKLSEMWNEVESGDMPLWFYLPLHGDARLSAADKDVLRAWAISTSSHTNDEPAK
jgi:hypothetical protein